MSLTVPKVNRRGSWNLLGIDPEEMNDPSGSFLAGAFKKAFGPGGNFLFAETMTRRASSRTGHGAICRMEDSPYYIHKLSSQGAISKMEKLLLGQPELATRQDAKGRTPMHHAAARGRCQAIDLLLEKKANINARDFEGNTPLHDACEKGNLGSVKHLLAKKANGNVLNEKKYGPLHVATLQNKPAIIGALSRMDINLRGHQGGTALHYAASLNYAECVQKLVGLGCKLTSTDDNGYYPILLAAKNASVQALEMFLQIAPTCGYTTQMLLGYKDRERNAALHLAINSGNVQTVKVCLQYGASIEARQNDQATAFHLACSQGTLAIVQCMYEAHSEKMDEQAMEVLFTRDVVDMTPIHKAAMFDHAEVVQYLIAIGSELDPLDMENRSPLLLAASRGGVRSLHVLLTAGADVSVKDDSQRNVMHFMVTCGAAVADELEMIVAKDRKLLNQKDAMGCTPLHVASKQGNLRLLESLLRLGALINPKDNEEQSPLHFAASYGRINTVQRLLRSDQGPNIINECDGSGMTALHLAAMNGHTKVVQLLLYKGALLHRDFLGRTTLHLASEEGYTHTMRLLLSFHVNLLDQTDKSGNTAMHYAAMASKPNSLKMLMSANAEYGVNKDGYTPMDICIENTFIECAIVLVEHDRWDEVLHRRSAMYTSPLLGLIQHLPEVHKIVLDRCHTTATCDPNSREYWVMACKCPTWIVVFEEHFNFNYMQVKAEYMKKIKKKMKNVVPLLALNQMVKYGRVELLSHPVCLHYLRMKWTAYGFWVFSVSIIFYVLFLAGLSWTIATIDPQKKICNASEEHSAFDWLLSNNDTLHGSYANNGENGRSIFTWMTLIYLVIFVIANFVKEGYQVYEQRNSYLNDLVNYSEWTMYFTTLILVIPMLMQPEDCFTRLQWQCSAISVFLAWFNLLIYLSSSQSLGIYIVMFLHILKTVLRVTVVFSVLFIAFGLTFHTLHIQDERQGFGFTFVAVIRTVLMMMGDWEFVNMYVKPYTTDLMAFPVLNFFFLILFIILMPILFINLLIGLAVGDIEMVLKDAQLKRLAMQVDYHTELEQRMPLWILKRVDISESTIYPNAYRLDSTHLPVFKQLIHWLRETFGIQEGVTPNSFKAMMDPQGQANALVLGEIAKARKKIVKDLQSHLDKHHDLLRLVVQKMEISSDVDQYDDGEEGNKEGQRGGFAKHVRRIMRPTVAFAQGAPNKPDEEYSTTM